MVGVAQSSLIQGYVQVLPTLVKQYGTSTAVWAGNSFTNVRTAAPARRSRRPDTDKSKRTYAAAKRHLDVSRARGANRPNLHPKQIPDACGNQISRIKSRLLCLSDPKIARMQPVSISCFELIELNLQQFPHTRATMMTPVL